jgi:hypothetical protein
VVNVEEARELAMTHPCPACKLPAGSRCVNPRTGADLGGIHMMRVDRALVVTDAIAHNEAALRGEKAEKRMAYAIPPVRTFESTITDLNGIRVTTTITVPVAAEWDEVRECSELASMGSTTTANYVARSIAASAEKEVPF